MSHGYPGKKKEIWVPGFTPFPQYIIDHVNEGYAIEAHNCQFERAVWFFQLSVKLGIPSPKHWIDTLASCAYRGLPLGLDDVGKVLDLPIQKDKRGKFLINKLCKPQKPTKKNPETRCRDPELLQELYAYCIQDGEAEDALGSAVGDLPVGEYRTWVLDQTINARGVHVDTEAVASALYIVNTITNRLETRLRELTSEQVKSGSEVAKIVAWCNDNGLALSNLQAGTVETLLDQHDAAVRECEKDPSDVIAALDKLPDNVVEVLRIRQQLSRASAKKLIKFRDCVNADGYIRGLLQYHGAGTGRWAGRLVQPQNFPRGSLDLNKKITKWNSDETMREIIDCIKMRDPDILALYFGDPMEAVATALRGMFISSPGKMFYVADFAAIEARVVMWLAGQMDAIEAFHAYDRKEGPDIYCVMAAKIYNRPINKDDNPDERQLGKITILGCGYQMSGRRLREQASDAYGIEISLETAEMLVSKYREQYAMVPALWRNLENAAISAVNRKGSEFVTGPNGVTIGFQYVTDKAGNWLTMILPNGRRLWYFNPGTEVKEIEYIDKQTGDTKTFTKDCLFYYGRDNKKGRAWGKVFSYGGMLTENAVQAIARDLMVAAMSRVEEAGFDIVMSVHDELVAEAEPNRTAKEFEALVAGPNPKWAAGCPVAAEGWKGDRYRK
jgi:DNA polymerase